VDVSRSGAGATGGVGVLESRGAFRAGRDSLPVEGFGASSGRDGSLKGTLSTTEDGARTLPTELDVRGDAGAGVTGATSTQQSLDDEATTG